MVDISVLMGTGFISYHYYFGHFDVPDSYKAAITFSGLLALIVYPYCGVYQSWRSSSFINEIKTLFIAYTSIFTTLVVISFALKVSIEFSRMWAGYWYLTGLVMWSGTRLTTRITLHYIRQQGINKRSVLVVGSGERAIQVARNIMEASWTGLSVEGLVDTKNQPIYTSDLQTVCNIEKLGKHLEKHPVDQIWIALSISESEKVTHILKALETSTADIKMVPDLYGLQLMNHSITEINSMPILNLSVSPMEGFNYIAKNIEDKVISLLMLLVLSPIMLIIAILIKVSSQGPVFYRQERVGWNNISFEMIKFRSMSLDCEKNGIFWGKANEKKVTPIGRLLRNSSLDELPQLINVLKGEMSIVGPRPERTQFVNQFKYEIKDYMKKHMVKAGITGWAQINGWRGDTDLEKRVEHDLYYINHWSIGFDLRIILSTIFSVIK